MTSTVRSEQPETRDASLFRLFTTLLKQDRIHTISETEPWGTLIASGAKRNETRTWPARLSRNGPIYRGPIAIHLSKQMDDSICSLEPFASALDEAGYEPSPLHPRGNSWGLPLGHVIAVAWLEDVWQINQHTAHRVPNENSAEYAFGKYDPGRFVWTFSCTYRLSQPVRIERGFPSIWAWTPPAHIWDEIQSEADRLRIGSK